MTTTAVPTQKRFDALDIFRGMTICFMIIVNTSGNGATTYWPLRHIDWNGFTPTDLVFPSFLFAVGTALAFVSKKWANMSQRDVLFKIGKRTLLIFLIGYLMYWFPFFRLDEQMHISAFPISDTRIMGVLQRIALCYGITALLVYYLGHKRTIIVASSLLVVYWILLLVFGGDEPFSKTGNAVLKLDTWALGIKHLYTGEGFPFDPEGILSTLPAVFNVAMGYATGYFLLKKGTTYEAISKLLLGAFGLLILAYILNNFIPVNKKLWTSSYSLLTVGLDLLIISFIIYITEMLNFKKGSQFFIIAGKNPLLIYILSELGVVVLYMVHIGNVPLFSWIYTNIFQHAGNYLGAFLFAIWWMLTCWLIGYILHKKNIYVKI